MQSNGALRWGRTDCVVMLTWSDWKTEPRSNRYHYATRFARHLPVVFVQPDLEQDGSAFEATQFSGISILHVPRRPGEVQSAAIHQALARRKLLNPMLWIYNPYFDQYVQGAYATYRIYHATEDYFCSESAVGFRDEELKNALRRVIASVDLVCAVSEDVRASYQREAPSSAEFVVLPNGCDFAFLQRSVTGLSGRDANPKIAVYQGGINPRLDTRLITTLAKELPDWELHFAGKVDSRSAADWQLIIQCPNVVYLGELDADSLAQAMVRATVGIIPFVESELILRSLPLKAYEYAACGLPVVTVPIRALEAHPDLFSFATGAHEFALKIREAAATRFDSAALERRFSKAALVDYEATFQGLVALLAQRLSPAVASHGASLNILLLYDPGAMHISTVDEHVLSFQRFSRHTVHYAAGTRDATLGVSPSCYDVIVLHYSVRLSLEDFLPAGLAEKISAFSGLKVLFIQDEYETTETARRWMDRLGIHLMFTCVSPQHVRSVYPLARYPGMTFAHTLTGYAPDDGKMARFRKPLPARRFAIGYRGRPLPYWYGDLGREKVVIGQVMRRICDERRVPSDIDWTHEARIYGDRWYEFLGNCRATLGTESGSNVFDDEGTIRASIEQALLANPALTYEEAHAQYIGAREGQVVMNQVSPKVFEAISLRTALVLFEGSYSGVVAPDMHFIALKKDFSNVDEVLDKVADDAFLESLTHRAYEDIIASERYSYRAFVADFDRQIDAMMHQRRTGRVLSLSLLNLGMDGRAPPAPPEIITIAATPTTAPLTPDERLQLKDLAVVIRPEPILKVLFRDLRLSGHIKLRSSLRFYPEHELDCVLQPDPATGYAAALENQRKPQRFEIRFDQCVGLLQLTLVWESTANRAADYTVDVLLGRTLVHRVPVRNNPDQTNTIDVPLNVADRIRVSIDRYFGQDRLLIRQIMVTTIGSGNEPHPAKPSTYPRRFWNFLTRLPHSRTASRLNRPCTSRDTGQPQ